LFLKGKATTAEVGSERKLHIKKIPNLIGGRNTGMGTFPSIIFGEKGKERNSRTVLEKKRRKKTCPGVRSTLPFGIGKEEETYR